MFVERLREGGISIIINGCDNNERVELFEFSMIDTDAYANAKTHIEGNETRG